MLKKFIALFVLLIILPVGFSIRCNFVESVILPANSYDVYDCDGVTCESDAFDIRGECNFWGFSEDNLPTTSQLVYSWVDNGGGSVALFIDSPWDVEPVCELFDTGSSTTGIAPCETGRLDCTQGYFNSNMGCETSCDECTSDSDCNSYETIDFEATCNTNTHCNFCEQIERVCSIESDAYCPTGCYYNNDIDCNSCPSGSLPFLNPVSGNRECKVPGCYYDGDCTGTSVCRNPGQTNAYCANQVDGSDSFYLAEASVTIDEENYDVGIYNNGINDVAKIYNNDETVQAGLVSGSYFSIEDNNYKIFFSTGINPNDFSLQIFRVEFYNRLTYNIFPVCGNQVCETCEDSNNCVHYPPESCMSCPGDCPGITEEELNSFNSNFGVSFSLGDVSVNNDLSCKVKTGDASSVCNPLCLTHDFIDSNGCIFNRYRNSLPTNFEESITTSGVSFDGRTFDAAYYDNGFLGEVIGETIPNSECTSDCECNSNNCDNGHCCPTGFIWSDESSKDLVCDGNGRVTAEFRATLVDNDGDGYIDITQGVDIIGKKLSEFICDDCAYDPMCAYETPNGYEAIQPNGVGQCRSLELETTSVVPSVACTIHSHAWALAECDNPQWYCWGGCCDDLFGKVDPYSTQYCVTDNPDECASGECVREYLYDSEPILRSITYEEFCTNAGFVCASSDLFTNDEDNYGSIINYVNCPQDSSIELYYKYPTTMTIGQYCSIFGNDFEKIMNINEGTLFDKESGNTNGAELIFSYVEEDTNKVSLTYLVDNDFYIVNENGAYRKTTHLPSIDRDAEERLYHELWNHDSCVEIFGEELVPDCENANIPRNDRKVYGFNFEDNNVEYEEFTGIDENGNPTSVLGRYNIFLEYSDFEFYSNETCQRFWTAYEEEYGTYDWHWLYKNPSYNPTVLDLNPNLNQDSVLTFDLNGNGIINNDERNIRLFLDIYNIESPIIESSCIWWYEPFLEEYYDVTNEMYEFTGQNFVGAIGTNYFNYYEVFNGYYQSSEYLFYKYLDRDLMTPDVSCGSNNLIRPGFECE